MQGVAQPRLTWSSGDASWMHGSKVSGDDGSCVRSVKILCWLVPVYHQVDPLRGAMNTDDL